jgi:hypothetical protein
VCTAWTDTQGVNIGDFVIFSLDTLHYQIKRNWIKIGL